MILIVSFPIPFGRLFIKNACWMLLIMSPKNNANHKDYGS